MSRRTLERDVRSGSPSYTTDLRRAIQAYLPRSGLALVVDDRKLRWVPRMLVTCAILMTWDASAALADAFERARSAVVKMYKSRRRPGDSYGGFMATLAGRGASHLAVVAAGLREHVRRLGESCSRWRTGRWAVFGVDGSKLECPMTAANERALGTAGKNKTGPQQFLTTIFHVGSGLIWDFRRGDSRASERSHLLQMLDTLPAGEGTMLLADAGFTGYDLLRTITSGGRSFLIRVGSNVRLLTQLGWHCDEHDGVVYLWPQKAKKAGQTPLTLRLITLVDGRNRRIHLLTDVLDGRELSDAGAAGQYRMRWGVELIFRSLKQTLGKRRLRCDSPANAAAELDWAVVGLWLLGLMSVERIVAAGGQAGDWSVASSLRVVRRAMADKPPGGGKGKDKGSSSLARALAAAVKDAYTRTRPKTARHWPHKKKDKPPGDPKARMANASEIQLAAELKQQRPAA